MVGRVGKTYLVDEILQIELYLDMLAFRQQIKEILSELNTQINEENMDLGGIY